MVTEQARTKSFSGWRVGTRAQSVILTFPISLAEDTNNITCVGIIIIAGQPGHQKKEKEKNDSLEIC